MTTPASARKRPKIHGKFEDEVVNRRVSRGENSPEYETKYSTAELVPLLVPPKVSSSSEKKEVGSRPPSIPGLGYSLTKRSCEFRQLPTTSKDSWPDFLAKVQHSSGVTVESLFRAIFAVVSPHARCGLDYHMRIEPHSSGFQIRFLLDRKGPGPVSAPQCMSCDFDCPLEMGLAGESGATSDQILENQVGPGTEGSTHSELRSPGNRSRITSKTTLLYELGTGKRPDEGVVRVWMDAKARNMLILTPKRHVESMHAMSDSELEGFWNGMREVLSREQLSWRSISAVIVNSGSERNHAHLHMKIKIDGQAFSRAREKWDVDCQRRWDELARFALDYGRPVLQQVLLKAPEQVRTVFIGELIKKGEVPVIALQDELFEKFSKYGAVMNV